MKLSQIPSSPSLCITIHVFQQDVDELGRMAASQTNAEHYKDRMLTFLGLSCIGLDSLVHTQPKYAASIKVVCDEASEVFQQLLFRFVDEQISSSFNTKLINPENIPSPRGPVYKAHNSSKLVLKNTWAYDDLQQSDTTYLVMSKVKTFFQRSSKIFFGSLQLKIVPIFQKECVNQFMDYILCQVPICM